MKKLTLAALALLGFSAFSAAQTPIEYPKYNPDDITIPHQKFTLPNGLTLIVAEDHKAPIVAVNTWYHVGSKNEKVNKSGFAHLFEHLMFNGSENYNTDYFKVLEAIGGTDLNGTTNNDRTNYFQNVPLNALDQVLFLESDRMGHLLGALDQGKLDEQRGVVQNEKRQGENQPYAKGWDMVEKNLFPKGHPYSWTVIGEMEDLNAASVADVHEWFKAYYGAANAVVCLAGDITPEVAFEKVKKYYGDIPSGPTIARPDVNIPIRKGESRSTYQDRVPQSRILDSWVAAPWGTEEAVALDLACDVLGTGKTSRLFKKLVYEKQIATAVSIGLDTRELCSVIYLTVDVKPGRSVEEVEAATNEIIADFLEKGPTEDEVNRVRAGFFAGFVKGLERIGGFGGKSDRLLENATYGGDPNFYKKQLEWYNRITAASMLAASKKWMSDGRDVIVCNPFPTFSTTEGLKREKNKLPELGPAVSGKFPDIQRATLSNGMKIVLAERKGSPTVVMNLMMDGGFAADKISKDGKLGLARMSMDMMDEGTKSLSSLQISERMQILGAGFSTNADLDFCNASLNALLPSLDPALDIWADVILNPAFPEKELARIKDETIARIAREKSEPSSNLIRIMPELLYGKDHPYAQPLSGTGETETVQTITRDDVEKFYKTWIRPNNATIVVTGDISMADLKMKLEKRFSKWQKADVPKKIIPKVATDATKGTLFIVDRPESEQSQIFAGYLIDGYGQVDENGLEIMNNVLGGDFTSRINMNLREDKHWSYGAGAFVMNTQGQRPFLVQAPVQTDKTAESIVEVMKEFKDFVGSKPITQAEFDKTKSNTVMGLPGLWETNGRTQRFVTDLVRYNLKDDHWKSYDAAIRGLKLDDVNALARKTVKTSDLSWFMVGDEAKVAEGLKKLDVKIIQLDANGKPKAAAVKIKP